MKRSEAQNQRPHKLLWMLWFDEKSISNLSTNTWVKNYDFYKEKYATCFLATILKELHEWFWFWWFCMPGALQRVHVLDFTKIWLCTQTQSKWILRQVGLRVTGPVDFHLIFWVDNFQKKNYLVKSQKIKTRRAVSPANFWFWKDELAFFFHFLTF